MIEKKFGKNVLILGNKCYRCSYEWKPSNLEKEVKTCPSCRSPYWDKPLERKNVSNSVREANTKKI
jgi:predicted Zn-ribbon and HTH transcriptional regulator